MKSEYAIFISTNEKYLPYTNALLNSLAGIDWNHDVYLLHYEFNNQKYLEDCINKLPYPIIPIKIDDEDFEINKRSELLVSKNLFIKQSRFKYISQIAPEYDAICLLDADMFVVNRNFKGLFDLVKKTNKLIGCNERFKWTFGKQFIYNDKPIFDRTFRASKFHCSVPIILDYLNWGSVFDYYNQLAFNSYEKKHDVLKRIGDMYCWNISVYKNNRENDVVLFPMETMTQVHFTSINPMTIIKRYSNNQWYSYQGDEVFTIHGRIGKRWEKEQIKNFQKNMSPNLTESYNARCLASAQNTLKQIKETWNFLNNECTLKLKEYV